MPWNKFKQTKIDVKLFQEEQLFDKESEDIHTASNFIPDIRLRSAKAIYLLRSINDDGGLNKKNKLNVLLILKLIIISILYSYNFFTVNTIIITK